MKKYAALLLMFSAVFSLCSCKSSKDMSSSALSSANSNADTSLISSINTVEDKEPAEDTKTQTEAVTSVNKGTSEQSEKKEPVTSTRTVTEKTKTEPQIPQKKPQQNPSPAKEELPPSIPAQAKPTEREVAERLIYHINRLRVADGKKSMTELAGLTKVSEYRSRQIIKNFAHDTHEIREATAYYKYGRYVDMTMFGYDESYSYYEYSGGEALTKGAWEGTADQIGKEIAELIKSSNNHWSYVGSDEYSYIAVGITYDDSTEYKWYVCVTVSDTNEFE